MSFINMDKRFKISKILIDNYILILLMLVLVTYKGSNAFGFDSASSCSPNGKLSRRGRAQIIASIPCDLTRQPYCNLPGAAYPWHAVRRFVHENQGLMKRMYGDMRHISVLRDEIRNNEIDVEDIEIAAQRYSRSGSKRASKYMHQHSEEFLGAAGTRHNDDIKKQRSSPSSTTTLSAIESVVETDGHDTTTLPNKVDTAIKGDTIIIKNQSDIEKSEPIDNIESLSKVNKVRENSTVHSIKHENNTQYANDDSNLASNSVYELPTLTANEVISPSTDGDNIEIIESPQINIEIKTLNQQPSTIPTKLKTSTTTSTTITPKSQTTTTVRSYQPETKTKTKTTPPITTTTTTKRTTISYIDSYRRRPQYTNRYRPMQLQQKTQQQQHIFKINITNFTTKENQLETNSKQEVNESERIFNTTTTPLSTTNSTADQISLSKTTAPIKRTQLSNSDHSSVISATLNTPKAPNQTIENGSPIEKPLIIQQSAMATHSSAATFSFVKPKIELFSAEKLRRQPTTPANKPITTPTASPSASVTKPPVLRDGQLFQDTVKQESAPVANLKGINACPVKEEVVAPFWANNTRGEVLALLNLYPFEQYVHWEKCTHEHKQMYCREGCRCEQQYRLHRLLAYDPHNECRGIFSDWFRFPSCCICKCYNIPMEFRATSRSPRMQSFPSDSSDDNTTNDPEDHKHPLDIAEEQVKRAIYEHAAEEWYRPRDDYDYYAED